MFEISKLKPGAVITALFSNTADLNKGGRNGTAINPLFGEVVVARVVTGKAASEAMYKRAWLARNPGEDYLPISNDTPHPSNKVVVISPNGDEKVRVINPIWSNPAYTIAGKPATLEQLEIINLYSKPARIPDARRVPLAMPYLKNLASVEEPEAEEQE